MVRAKVVETSEPRIVDTWNGRLLFSMVVVSDGTGTIKVPLWYRRVGRASVGDIVLVEGEQGLPWRVTAPSWPWNNQCGGAAS